MTSEIIKESYPKAKKGSKILIIGGTGGIGKALQKMLRTSEKIFLGVHGTAEIFNDKENFLYIKKTLNSENDCHYVLQKFINTAGGIDILVNLAGGIHFSGHWLDMSEPDYMKDINLNLNMAFFLSRIALRHMMKNNNWGRIILTGTESALHGGSELSFPYAISKRATECLVQGLAREGAKNNILVNGIRMGFIESGFHQRWHNKNSNDLKDRASLVPLKRGGTVEEVASLMIYLMSDYSDFITGQMIPITGGDWL